MAHPSIFHSIDHFSKLNRQEENEGFELLGRTKKDFSLPGVILEYLITYGLFHLEAS